MSFSLTQAQNHSADEEQAAAEKRRKRLLFWENVNILFKTTGMIVWCIVFFLAILELKRYFNLDLIPGYDSAFESVYGSMRGTIVNGVKDLQ